MSYTKLNKLIGLWYYITVIFIVYFAAKFAIPILLPFLISIVVASVLKSPIDHLNKKLNLNRCFLSFLCVGLVLLIIVFVLSLLLYSIYNWLIDLLDYLPDLLPTLTSVSEKITKTLNNVMHSMPESVKDGIKQMPTKLIEGATARITQALSDIAKGLPNFFITLFVTIISSFLVTRDYKKLTAFAKNTIPAKRFNQILSTKKILSEKVVGSIKSYSVITVITFVELLIGLMLMRIKHAAAIASIVAVIDLLPVLGVGIVLIPWSVFEFISGNNTLGVCFILLYLIITVVHNFIAPKLVANQIKLDALTVLVTMYLGYSLIGFWGLIISPIVAAVIRDIIMNEKAEPV